MKNGYTYACKIIAKAKTSTVYRERFLPRELKILGSTKHPHIARVLAIIDEPEKVFIIMEMAAGGDLLSKILKVHRFDEETAHRFFMQLVSALAYLHQNDIAHRDLKCENVLLTKDDLVKLADFSFARYCSDEVTNKPDALSDTFCGSQAYAAPEILQGICYLPKMADVWSLGVILYVMVTGLLPFRGSSVYHQVRLQMTRTLRFPEVLTISRELKNEVRGMLEPVVAQRSSMARVIRHPWVTMYKSPFAELRQIMLESAAEQRRASKLVRMEGNSGNSASETGSPQENLSDDATTDIVAVAMDDDTRYMGSTKEGAKNKSTGLPKKPATDRRSSSATSNRSSQRPHRRHEDDDEERHLRVAREEDPVNGTSSRVMTRLSGA
ncbi:testis-specific serine/threonine-protein kinase 6-like [Haemaphysalis longicornis]